jgi:hypothetical protein
MNIIIQIIEALPYIITAASAICAATPTQKDDKILGKAYKLLELLALNVGKAKQ